MNEIISNPRFVYLREDLVSGIGRYLDELDINFDTSKSDLNILNNLVDEDSRRLIDNARIDKEPIDLSNVTFFERSTSLRTRLYGGMVIMTTLAQHIAEGDFIVKRQPQHLDSQTVLTSVNAVQYSEADSMLPIESDITYIFRPNEYNVLRNGYKFYTRPNREVTLESVILDQNNHSLKFLRSLLGRVIELND